MTAGLPARLEDVRRLLLERHRELPMLPLVVARLVQLDRESDTYFEEVLELLQEDPPFAARLLRFVNSALHAPTDPVVTIRSCLSRLGTHRVAELITSTAVALVFVPQTAGQRQLWGHAVQTGSGAQFLAESWSASEVEPEHAYLAGLLHDLGRYVMLREHPEDFDGPDARAWFPEVGALESERQRYAYDHTEVGALLAVSWGLSESVAVVIAAHHRQPVDAQDHLTAHERDTVRLVQCADRLSQLLLADERLVEADVAEQHQVLHGAFRAPGWIGRHPPVELLVEALEPMTADGRSAMELLGLA